jgi:hypothetical protein
VVGAKIGWKLVLAAFTMVVTLVANKALTAAWKVGAGDKPPKKGTKEAGYAEVVTWAVASGGAAAAAKLFAERRAAQYYLKSTGHLPPGYEKDAAKDLEKA